LLSPNASIGLIVDSMSKLRRVSKPSQNRVKRLVLLRSGVIKSSGVLDPAFLL
jgi:hypothetical protein